MNAEKNFEWNLISTEELSKFTGYARSTILNKIREGLLNSLRVRVHARGSKRMFVIKDELYRKFMHVIENITTDIPENSIIEKDIVVKYSITRQILRYYQQTGKVKGFWVRRKVGDRYKFEYRYMDDKNLAEALENYSKRYKKKKSIIKIKNQPCWHYRNDAMGGAIASMENSFNE